METKSPLGTHKASSPNLRTFTVSNENQKVQGTSGPTIIEGTNYLKGRENFFKEENETLSLDQKERINALLDIGKIFAPVEIDNKVIVLSSLKNKIRKDITKNSDEIANIMDKTYYIMYTTLAYSVVKIIDKTGDIKTDYWKTEPNKYWIPELDLESKVELLAEMQDWIEELFSEYLNKIQKRLTVKTAEVTEDIKK